MWWNLFRAEIYKINGNRWVTGCLLWTFPISAVLLMGFLLVGVTFVPAVRESFRDAPPLWTTSALDTWNVPNSPLGRIMLIGFTALLFGGEYQWNTWKAIVPRTWRIPLLLVKFLAMGAFIVFVIGLTSILFVVANGLATLLAGGTYEPHLTNEVLTEFAQDYTIQVFIAFTTTLLASTFATFAAMVTRSILGSIVGGLGLSLAEATSLLALQGFAYFSKIDEVLHLYRLTPTYNFVNLTLWVNGEKGLEFTIGDMLVKDSALFSIMILLIWVLGTMGATLFIFQQQDIKN
jgi:ABC-type transport system involved in multi-copper enzyme maturation permease subunit